MPSVYTEARLPKPVRLRGSREIGPPPPQHQNPGIGPGSVPGVVTRINQLGRVLPFLCTPPPPYITFSSK